MSRTLKEAFNVKFHDESAFEDFCNLDLIEEITSFTAIKNGHERKVFKPSAKLKKYLSFINGLILRYLEKDEEVVHSFIKQKSTLTAVKEHKNSKFFFKTDIEQFYSNIKRENVIQVLEKNSNNIPISDIESYTEFLADITTYEDSIPVGFPTSPSLSNAFLFDFDREVKQLCEENNLIYTRYADDIIISSDSIEYLRELNDKIPKLLKEHASQRITINEKKTYITHKGNKVKLLGLVILPNGRVSIDAKYKKNIETILYSFANDKERYQTLLKQHFKNDEHSLYGLLHYAKSIDPEYIDKLQRKYGAYTLRKSMKDRWNDNNG